MHPVKILEQKYELTPLSKTCLYSEYEITKLKLEFSYFMAQKDKTSLYNALQKYTKIQEWIGPEDQETLRVKLPKLTQINLQRLASELFLSSAYTKRICENITQPVCFTHSIQYEPYFKQYTLRLHFKNTVIPENPLKGEEYTKRQQELISILTNVKQTRPEIALVTSGTWLNNYPSYTSLKPDLEILMTRNKKTPAGQSLWGQFYRHTGELNHERIKEFQSTWGPDWHFPLPQIVAVCRTRDFYEKYNIK